MTDTTADTTDPIDPKPRTTPLEPEDEALYDNARDAGRMILKQFQRAADALEARGTASAILDERMAKAFERIAGAAERIAQRLDPR